MSKSYFYNFKSLENRRRLYYNMQENYLWATVEQIRAQFIESASFLLIITFKFVEDYTNKLHNSELAPYWTLNNSMSIIGLERGKTALY